MSMFITEILTKAMLWINLSAYLQMNRYIKCGKTYVFYIHSSNKE